MSPTLHDMLIAGVSLYDLLVTGVSLIVIAVGIAVWWGVAEILDDIPETFHRDDFWGL